jgi:hypothetical protein
MKRSRLIGTVVCGVAIVACNRKSAPPPPSIEPPPIAERITGAERLGWEQQAVDAVELAKLRFAIYVDGARFDLTDASCAKNPSAAGFSCRARLPPMAAGAHTLQLTVFIVDGATRLESARSAALHVIVGP